LDKNIEQKVDEITDIRNAFKDVVRKEDAEKPNDEKTDDKDNETKSDIKNTTEPDKKAIDKDDDDETLCNDDKITELAAITFNKVKVTGESCYNILEPQAMYDNDETEKVTMSEDSTTYTDIPDKSALIDEEPKKSTVDSEILEDKGETTCQSKKNQNTNSIEEPGSLKETAREKGKTEPETKEEVPKNYSEEDRKTTRDNLVASGHERLILRHDVRTVSDKENSLNKSDSSLSIKQSESTVSNKKDSLAKSDNYPTIEQRMRSFSGVVISLNKEYSGDVVEHIRDNLVVPGQERLLLGHGGRTVSDKENSLTTMDNNPTIEQREKFQ
jgi:hypothetical protein